MLASSIVSVHAPGQATRHMILLLYCVQRHAAIFGLIGNGIFVWVDQILSFRVDCVCTRFNENVREENMLY